MYQTINVSSKVYSWHSRPRRSFFEVSATEETFRFALSVTADVEAIKRKYEHVRNPTGNNIEHSNVKSRARCAHVHMAWIGCRYHVWRHCKDPASCIIAQKIIKLSKLNAIICWFYVLIVWNLFWDLDELAIIYFRPEQPDVLGLVCYYSVDTRINKNSSVQNS